MELFLPSVLILLSGLGSSTAQEPVSKETLTCFNSSDLGAVNATLLYEDNSTTGHLWSRADGSADPVPRCTSSSYSPLPSQCEVCHLQEVYMICNNLAASAHLKLEGSGKSYVTTKCICPTLPAEPHKRNHVVAICVPVVFLIIIIIIGAVILIHHFSRDSQKNPV